MRLHVTRKSICCWQPARCYAQASRHFRIRTAQLLFESV